MAIEHTNLVAGLFRSRARADAAVQSLYRLGLADRDIEIGAPEPGRYGIEYHESEALGRGVVMGVALGVPAGSVVAMGLLMFTVPDMSMAGIVGLGILIGGFWGIFFGGLGGMVVKVLAGGGWQSEVHRRRDHVGHCGDCARGQPDRCGAPGAP